MKALDEAIDAIERATREVEDALERSAFDPHELERCEERLFALRAMGRKHNVPIENLPALAQKFADDLAALAAGRSEIGRLEASVKGAARGLPRRGERAQRRARDERARTHDGGRRGIGAAQARAGRVQRRLEARRGARFAERVRPGGILRSHQSRLAAGPADESGLGRRARQVPARDQGAIGRARHRADPGLRRDRHRRRRRRRRRDGPAPGAALGGRSGAGGDACAAGRRAGAEPLSGSPKAILARASGSRPAFRGSARPSGERKSRACWPARKSPTRLAPPP